jgi:hypothetical protein
VNSENTFTKFSFNNLCSINSTLSTNGGTCRKILNEGNNKIHNLIIECEKEKNKNTSMDRLPILTKLCKILKMKQKRLSRIALMKLI